MEFRKPKNQILSEFRNGVFFIDIIELKHGLLIIASYFSTQKDNIHIRSHSHSDDEESAYELIGACRDY